LIRDRRRISENECAVATGSVADAIAGAAAGLDPDKVVAEILKLLLNTAAAGVSDCDDADERAYTHGNSKNGEQTSNPIPAQRRRCFPNCVLEVHPAI
jgi:predicted lipoprotein